MSDNEQYLPICTSCYSVRVEPHRAKALRPVCMACGDKVANQVRRTIVPMHKSNYVPVTDRTMLKQLTRPGRTLEG